MADDDVTPCPDSRETVAMCIRCGKTAYKGGSDADPGGHTPPANVARRWAFCAFGDGWSWCCTPPAEYKQYD